MAVKTPFSKDELVNLLDEYDLGDYEDHKPFDRGGDQTNYLVETTKGKYVFRYYEKRSMDYVLFEMELLHYLTRNSYPCPAPIKNERGEYAGSYREKPYALFTFIEGEHKNDAVRYAARR